jgi:hypothetical protein
MRKRTYLALGLVILVAFAACSGGGGDNDSGAAGRAPEPAAHKGVPGAEPVSGDIEQAQFSGADSGAGSVEPQSGELSTTGGGPFPDLPSVAARVIKTATVDIEVGDGKLSEALDEATGVMRRFGGFVLSSTIADERRGRAQLVLRVPAERFESALTELTDIGKVESRSISGEDVSQQFVDLEARRRNLEVQETVMLRLMRRATTIQDTIVVQRELQQIQLEIERITGRLNYLEDQTALSTISVSFVETGAPAPGGKNTLERAWERAADTTLAILSGTIIAAGAITPVVILGALIYVIGALVLRKLRPRLGLE